MPKLTRRLKAKKTSSGEDVKTGMALKSIREKKIPDEDLFEESKKGTMSKSVRKRLNKQFQIDPKSAAWKKANKTAMAQLASKKKVEAKPQLDDEVEMEDVWANNIENPNYTEGNRGLLLPHQGHSVNPRPSDRESLVMEVGGAAAFEFRKMDEMHARDANPLNRMLNDRLPDISDEALAEMSFNEKAKLALSTVEAGDPLPEPKMNQPKPASSTAVLNRRLKHEALLKQHIEAKEVKQKESQVNNVMDIVDELNAELAAQKAKREYKSGLREARDMMASDGNLISGKRVGGSRIPMSIERESFAPLQESDGSLRNLDTQTCGFSAGNQNATELYASFCRRGMMEFNPALDPNAAHSILNHEKEKTKDLHRRRHVRIGNKVDYREHERWQKQQEDNQRNSGHHQLL